MRDDVDNPRRKFSRFFWLLPLPIFGFALKLTQSRGGLLAILAGMGVFLWARFGLRKAVSVLALGLPLVFLYLGSRQISLDSSKGTGQQRIQIWMDGFATLRQSPLLGIGTEQFATHMGKAAHNAFVCAYTETGLVGGTLFFGMYYCVLSSLVNVVLHREKVQNPELRSLVPVVVAIVASYAMSEMSLTHPFSVPTYLVLGVGTALIRLVEADVGGHFASIAKGGGGAEDNCRFGDLHC